MSMADRTYTMPHVSPHTARAVGLTACSEEPEPEPGPKTEARAAAATAAEPEPEPEPEYGLYLPTKFDESTGAAVEFSAYGWQAHVQRVAEALPRVALREVAGRQKTGQDRVICVIMQPYHLFREHYVGRMLNRNCWATKFFGVPDLCEKLKMARYLASLAPLLGADSALLASAPKTFVLPADGAQLEGFMREGRTLIVKPAGGSQGKGIFITQSLEDIPRTEPSVAQEYVAEPLTLDGFKFDLRIYVIALGVGPGQRVFVMSEGLVRLCTKKYSSPSGTIRESDYARDALRAHLTNTSANKGSDDYDPNDSKRQLSAVLEQLSNSQTLGFEFREAEFWSQLEDLVRNWFLCMRPVMSLTFRQAAKAARSAALSQRKKPSGLRAFMAAQRKQVRVRVHCKRPERVS